MLHLEGEKDLSQAPKDVWNKLSDPQFLAQCIPGIESLTQTSPDSLKCTLRPGFTFVRGTLELTLAVLEKVPENFLRYLLTAKGIGSSSEVEASISLDSLGTGTRLRWSVDIKRLDGLLKMIPQGLIQAGAQQVVADAFATLEAKLNS
jgi:carbon monoxide dehydrogenase subunit G